MERQARGQDRHSRLAESWNQKPPHAECHAAKPLSHNQSRQERESRAPTEESGPAPDATKKSQVTIMGGGPDAERPER